MRNAASESSEELPKVLVGVVEDHDLYCADVGKVALALDSMYPLAAGTCILGVLLNGVDGESTKEICKAVTFAMLVVGVGDIEILVEDVKTPRPDEGTTEPSIACADEEMVEVLLEFKAPVPEARGGIAGWTLGKEEVPMLDVRTRELLISSEDK